MMVGSGTGQNPSTSGATSAAEEGPQRRGGRNVVTDVGSNTSSPAAAASASSALEQRLLDHSMPRMAPDFSNGLLRNRSTLHDPVRMLEQFWPRQMRQIKALTKAQLQESGRNQELPLARIKKIMKIDDDVRIQMISSEAPVLFAKAAEIFIEELTLRAWCHTEEHKRRTLQKSDISMAISRCEMFDFLIDIVPRDETLHRHSQSQSQHHQQQHQQVSTSGQQQRQASFAVDPSTGAVTLDAATLASLGYQMNNANTTNDDAANGEGGVQYFVQQGAPTSDHDTSPQLSAASMGQCGQVLQATQIGQPIPFQTTPGQTIQLITVGPDGQPIQYQLQLPAAEGEPT